MTSSSAHPGGERYADRSFRSPAAVAGGLLLLGFGLWMAVDAALNGGARTWLLAAAWLLLGGPVVTAFTLRPAVYLSDARLLVRNPLRTITIPWARVQSVEARYSTDVVADGTTYRLWAAPVSMGARKRAHRRALRAAAPAAGGPGGLFGRRWPAADPYQGGSADPREALAPADQAVRDVREYAERHAASPEADAPVRRRWAYELLAPALLGAVAVVLLNVLG